MTASKARQLTNKAFTDRPMELATIYAGIEEAAKKGNSYYCHPIWTKQRDIIDDENLIIIGTLVQNGFTVNTNQGNKILTLSIYW